MTYQHLLVAVDSKDPHPELIARAHQLARTFSARLSVLSVLPPAPMEMMPGDVGLTMSLPSSASQAWYEQMRDESHKALCTITVPFGIAEHDIHLTMGAADNSILDTAAKLGADLIVVGHHQHRGLSSWFSHTDESVVGKSICDVLTIALNH